MAETPGDQETDVPEVHERNTVVEVNEEGENLSIRLQTKGGTALLLVLLAGIMIGSFLTIFVGTLMALDDSRDIKQVPAIQSEATLYDLEGTFALEAQNHIAGSETMVEVRNRGKRVVKAHGFSVDFIRSEWDTITVVYYIDHGDTVTKLSLHPLNKLMGRFVHFELNRDIDDWSVDIYAPIDRDAQWETESVQISKAEYLKESAWPPAEDAQDK